MFRLPPIDSNDDVATPQHAASTQSSDPLHLIVNHCREKIHKWLPHWIEELQPNRVYIYSKCQDHPPSTNTNNDVHFINNVRVEVIPLENVGREGHSWLTHMLSSLLLKGEHHEPSSFATWNLFVQGGAEAKLDFVQESYHSLRTNPSLSSKYNFLDLSQDKMSHRFADPSYTGPYCYSYFNARCQGGWIAEGWTNATICHYHDRFKSSNVSCVDSNRLMLTARGEFLVQGAVLRAANRTKLEELHTYLSKSRNPAMGHLLERMWAEVLNATNWDMLDPKDRYRIDLPKDDGNGSEVPMEKVHQGANRENYQNRRLLND